MTVASLPWMVTPNSNPLVPSLLRGGDAGVVLNAVAGTVAGAPRIEDRVREIFRTKGVDAFITVAEPVAIESAVRLALDRGPGVIFVGGGDGTLNTAARMIMGSPVALGVLPLGTRNHFARDLGIPMILDDAIDALFRGEVIEVDVGEVNGLAFINNVSIGFYPQAVKQRIWNQQQIGLSKSMAMAYAVLNVFWRYPMHTMTVRHDFSEERIHTPFVLVGNNEYTTAGESLGRRASLVDGRLSVYYAHRIGRMRLLWAAVKALLGHVMQSAELQRILTETLVVMGRRHRRMEVAIDGEVCDLPRRLEFRVRPKALRVLVPRGHLAP